MIQKNALSLPERELCPFLAEGPRPWDPSEPLRPQRAATASQTKRQGAGPLGSTRPPAPASPNAVTGLAFRFQTARTNLPAHIASISYVLGTNEAAQN